MTYIQVSKSCQNLKFKSCSHISLSQKKKKWKSSQSITITVNKDSFVLRLFVYYNNNHNYSPQTKVTRKNPTKNTLAMWVINRGCVLRFPMKKNVLFFSLQKITMDRGVQNANKKNYTNATASASASASDVCRMRTQIQIEHSAQLHTAHCTYDSVYLFVSLLHVFNGKIA